MMKLKEEEADEALMLSISACTKEDNSNDSKDKPLQLDDVTSAADGLAASENKDGKSEKITNIIESFCKICNTELAPGENCELHKKSQDHVNSLKLEKDQEMVTEDDLVFEGVMCGICNVSFVSMAAYNSHLKGQSHLKNKRKSEESKLKVEEVQSTRKHRSCELCRMDFFSDHSYETHFSSQLHIDKEQWTKEWQEKKSKSVLLVEQEKGTVDPSTEIIENNVAKPDESSTAENIKPVELFECINKVEKENNQSGAELNSDGSLQPTGEKMVSKEEREMKNDRKAVFECKLCGISVVSSMTYEHHIKSKQHMLNLFHQTSGTAESSSKNEPVRNHSKLTLAAAKTTVSSDAFHCEDSNISNKSLNQHKSHLESNERNSDTVASLQTEQKATFPTSNESIMEKSDQKSVLSSPLPDKGKTIDSTSSGDCLFESSDQKSVHSSPLLATGKPTDSRSNDSNLKSSDYKSVLSSTLPAERKSTDLTSSSGSHLESGNKESVCSSSLLATGKPTDSTSNSDSNLKNSSKKSVFSSPLLAKGKPTDSTSNSDSNLKSSGQKSMHSSPLLAKGKPTDSTFSSDSHLENSDQESTIASSQPAIGDPCHPESSDSRIENNNNHESVVSTPQSAKEKSYDPSAVVELHLSKEKYTDQASNVYVRKGILKNNAKKSDKIESLDSAAEVCKSRKTSVKLTQVEEKSEHKNEKPSLLVVATQEENDQEEDTENFECKPCGVSIVGVMSYEHHLGSIQHILKLAQQPTSSKEVNKLPKQQNPIVAANNTKAVETFYCETCEYKSNTSAQHQAHLKSNDHNRTCFELQMSKLKSRKRLEKLKHIKLTQQPTNMNKTEGIVKEIIQKKANILSKFQNSTASQVSTNKTKAESLMREILQKKAKLFLESENSTASQVSSIVVRNEMDQTSKISKPCRSRFSSFESQPDVNLSSGYVTNLSATPTLNMSSTPTLNMSSTPTLNMSSTRTLNISSTPTLNMSSTPTLNMSSTPTLNMSSTPTLNMSSTPTLNMSSTPTLNMSSTRTLNISSTPTLNMSSTPTMNMSSTPTLNMSSTPTLNMSSTPTLNMCSTPTLNMSSTPTLNMSYTPTLNMSSTSTLNMSSTPTLNMSSTPTLNMSSTRTLNISSTPTLNMSSTPNLNMRTTPNLNMSSTPAVSFHSNNLSSTIAERSAVAVSTSFGTAADLNSLERHTSVTRPCKLEMISSNRPNNISTYVSEVRTMFDNLKNVERRAMGKTFSEKLHNLKISDIRRNVSENSDGTRTSISEKPQNTSDSDKRTLVSTTYPALASPHFINPVTAEISHSMGKTVPEKLQNTSEKKSTSDISEVMRKVLQRIQATKVSIPKTQQDTEVSDAIKKALERLQTTTDISFAKEKNFDMSKKPQITQVIDITHQERCNNNEISPASEKDRNTESSHTFKTILSERHHSTDLAHVFEKTVPENHKRTEIFDSFDKLFPERCRNAERSDTSKKHQSTERVHESEKIIPERHMGTEVPNALKVRLTEIHQNNEKSQEKRFSGGFQSNKVFNKKIFLKKFENTELYDERLEGKRFRGKYDTIEGLHENRLSEQSRTTELSNERRIPERYHKSEVLYEKRYSERDQNNEKRNLNSGMVHDVGQVIHEVSSDTGISSDPMKKIILKALESTAMSDQLRRSLIEKLSSTEISKLMERTMPETSQSAYIKGRISPVEHHDFETSHSIKNVCERPRNTELRRDTLRVRTQTSEVPCDTKSMAAEIQQNFGMSRTERIKDSIQHFHRLDGAAGKRFACKVCQVNHSSSPELIQHTDSREHLTNVELLRRFIARFRRLANSEDNQLTCCKCSFSCTLVRDFNRHILDTHWLRVLVMRKRKFGVSSSSSKSSVSHDSTEDEESRYLVPAKCARMHFECVLCKKSYSLEEDYKEHLKSDMHRERTRVVAHKNAALRVPQLDKITPNEKHSLREEVTAFSESLPRGSQKKLNTNLKRKPGKVVHVWSRK
ncbi:mucin-3B-like isoform X2 [Bacillus rossius redtenbacheri]